MELVIIDNVEEKRFQATIEGKVVFIDYIRAQNIVYLTHTEVPKVLEGRGIGKALVKGVLTIIKGERAELAPLCPFVAVYLSRYPEWKSILAKGYNV